MEPRRAPGPRSGVKLAGYARAAAVVALATATAATARALVDIPDVEMLFLLGVAIVAATSERGPSLLAAGLSVAAYDFFFVPPPLTLSVADARYLLTFGMMFGIGLVISTLAVRLREQRTAAFEREERTSVLYAVSRQLGSAVDARAVAEVCARAASEALQAEAAVLAPDREGALSALAACPEGVALRPEEREAALWAYRHGGEAVPAPGGSDEAALACVPLRALVDVHGVLAIRLPARGSLSGERRAFVDALCRQTALALERTRLAEDARKAALRAETEALRSELLSAVSHDLRTPLAAITGAASALRDEPDLDPGTRRDLVETACEEAERLERLVSNLLDMTRLDSGAVTPKREWVPLVEVAGAALTRMEHRLAGRPVRTLFPEDLPLLSVDPVLLEQLFLNLLENATKYTPPGSEIDLSASVQGDTVLVDLADRGPGIPAGERERVFDRFRRGVHPGVGGVGLGLPIARAIARTHGGSLVASGRPGGGALFRLSLPLPASPPGIDPGRREGT